MVWFFSVDQSTTLEKSNNNKKKKMQNDRHDRHGDGDVGGDDDDDDDGVDENRRRLDNQLKKLRNNEHRAFSFDEAQYATQEDRVAGRVLPQRWTSLHVHDVASALLVNTSIVDLNLDISCCTVLAIDLFLPFIRSSPRLEDLTVTYYPGPGSFNDNKEIQEQYEAGMSGVVHAVLDNPSIKKLVMEGSLGKNPGAMYDLLARTKTLNSFACEGAVVTREMAFAIAGGLARNTSLKNFVFEGTEGFVDIALSGIGFASTIESMTVGSDDANGEGVSEEVWLAISKILHVSPTLKQLEICVSDLDGANGCQDGDQVFLDLQNSACAGLEKLILKNVCLGRITLANHFPTDRCNDALQILDLADTRFVTRNCVSLLWNLVGLKELSIRYPICPPLLLNQAGPDCWAELVRRLKNISKVSIVVKASTWDHWAGGVVSGACGHDSLQSLNIEWDDEDGDNDVDERVGAQFRQLLAGNKRLEWLYLENGYFSQEAAAQLAEGLFHNTHLHRLTLYCCIISSHFMTMTLEWLLTNDSLTTFDSAVSTIENGDATSICRLYSSVFRHNNSLVYIHFPRLIINTEDMNSLVNGLVCNKSIVHIDFSSCDLDHGAWTRLEQALLQGSPNKISISSIRLPSISKTLRRSFLRNLPSMSGIKKVETFAYLDPDELNLLLHAVKERKTLLSFEGFDWDSLEVAHCAVEKEIQYYLKLNRFGRQVLDYSNVNESLWPVLLARTASEPKDLDALFFFLHDYFTNRRGGNHHQPSSSLVTQSAQQRMRDGDQSSRPYKVARLD
jgi:hypothetical protein